MWKTQICVTRPQCVKCALVNRAWRVLADIGKETASGYAESQRVWSVINWWGVGRHTEVACYIQSNANGYVARLGVNIPREIVARRLYHSSCHTYPIAVSQARSEVVTTFLGQVASCLWKYNVQDFDIPTRLTVSGSLCDYVQKGDLYLPVNATNYCRWTNRNKKTSNEKYCYWNLRSSETLRGVDW